MPRTEGQKAKNILFLLIYDEKTIKLLRLRRLVVEQDNERGFDLWESRMEERKREFEVRNAQAREQASQRFQQILGVRLDDNLGTVWADTNTRNVARVLSSTLSNELDRPPVVQELPEIGPLRLNGAVPQNLRDALTGRGSAQG